MRFTVRQARRLSEVSQREIARKLGISVDTYRNIERHPNKATIWQAQKISEITKIPCDNIFFGGDSA